MSINIPGGSVGNINAYNGGGVHINKSGSQRSDFSKSCGRWWFSRIIANDKVRIVQGV
jgi:hypothetical protein